MYLYISINISRNDVLTSLHSFYLYDSLTFVQSYLLEIYALADSMTPAGKEPANYARVYVTDWRNHKPGCLTQAKRRRTTHDILPQFPRINPNALAFPFNGILNTHVVILSK